MAAVSFLSAWDISLACNPTWVSPMSPSISAFGTKRGHAVNDNQVNGAASHQVLAYFERLLGAVGLRKQKVVEVDAASGGVAGIERVLGVNVGRRAAHLLRLGHDVVGQGGLAR